MTEAEAESYLAADMAAALAATVRYCPVLLNQPENRLAAVVDFTFNLGAGRLQTSTLLRRINQMNLTDAALNLRNHGFMAVAGCCRAWWRGDRQKLL